jgi:hypothetical protein
MSGGKLDPDALVTATAAELIRAPTFEVHFEAQSALQLVGLTQLCLRHPRLPVSSRELAERIILAARMHFSGFPAILEMIERGNDPAEDCL